MHKKEKKDSTPFLSRKKHACIATLVVILVRKTKKQGGNAHQKYSLDPLHTVSQSYKNKIPPHPPCPCTVLPRLPPKERSRVRGRDSGGRCDSVSWWLMAQLLTFTNTATKSLHWPPTHCFIVQKKKVNTAGPLDPFWHRAAPHPPLLIYFLIWPFRKMHFEISSRSTCLSVHPSWLHLLWFPLSAANTSASALCPHVLVQKKKKRKKKS